MPALPYTLPVSGTAPDQLAEKEAHEAAVQIPLDDLADRIATKADAATTAAALADKASAAQGAKADTAVQPAGLATALAAKADANGVATALAGKATAAQGAKADSAVQPAGLAAALVAKADAAATLAALADKATAAQGIRADTAVQPAVMVTALAAKADANDVATALAGKATSAQGAKADSAVQPAGLATALAAKADAAATAAALAGKATAAQGAKADTAVQPAVMATALDAKADAGATATALAGKATAAQGAKADTAVQPAGLASALADKADVAATAAALAGKATAAQGAKADTAVQPAVMATALAAKADAVAMATALVAKATAAQGAKADTAVQPAGLATALAVKADAAGMATALAGKATAAQGARADTAVQPATMATALDALAPAGDVARLYDMDSDRAELGRAFSPALTGAARPPMLKGAAAVNDALGGVWRLSGADAVAGAQDIAPMAAIAVEAGRIYEARFVLARSADPADPTGHSIEVRMQNLTKSRAGLSNVLIAAIADTTVAAGVQSYSFRFARDAGQDYQTPATARYVLPHLRLYGGDHLTDVAVIAVRDVTEEAGFAVADAALAAGIAGEAEARQAGDAAMAGGIAAEVAAGHAAVSGEADARQAGDDAIAARSVTGVGLATGGGPLTASRVITVMAASPAEGIAGLAADRAMTPEADRAALNARMEMDGGVEDTLQLVTTLRRVFATFGGNGLLALRYLGIDPADGDETLSLMSEGRRSAIRATAEGLRLGPLLLSGDGGGGFVLMNGLRRVILRTSADGVDIAGGLQITAAGVTFTGATPEADPELGGLLLGADALRLVSDRSVTLWPRAISGTRGDAPAGIVSVASQPALPGRGVMASARDGGIELDPARLGPTLDIVARNLGGEALTTATLAVSVASVPLAGSPAPKILALGDSITNRNMASMMDALLTGWGCAPVWIGTIEGSAHPTAASPVDGPLGEGREGWSTGDYLNTDPDSDVLGIVAPGGEASYAALTKESRRRWNPFVTGTTTVGAGGVFDVANYLSRFALDDPDFVLLNLGMNDLLENTSAAAIAQVEANLGTIIAAIRADLPAARILIWFTNIPRSVAADARWADVHRPMLAAIIALVRGLRTAGDTDLHLVPVWAVQSSEIGWPLAAGTIDADTGLTATTLSDIVHPLGINRTAAAELLAAAIATLL